MHIDLDTVSDSPDQKKEPSGKDKRNEQTKHIDYMNDPRINKEQTNEMHIELNEPRNVRKWIWATT